MEDFADYRFVRRSARAEDAPLLAVFIARAIFELIGHGFVYRDFSCQLRFHCGLVPFPKYFSIGAANVIRIEGERVGRISLAELTICEETDAASKRRCCYREDMAACRKGRPLWQRFEHFGIGGNPTN